MADAFIPHDPFGASEPPPFSGTPGLVLERLPDGTLFRMAARPGRTSELRARVQAALGVDPPEGPGVCGSEALCVVGIGPGTWLVRGVDAASLQEAAGAQASLFDWSDSRALLRIGGPDWRAALAKTLPIDLHPSRFGPGRAATTRAGHIGITLWQTAGSATVTTAVPRSLAADLLHGLLQCGAEFGVGLTALSPVLHPEPTTR